MSTGEHDISTAAHSSPFARMVTPARNPAAEAMAARALALRHAFAGMASRLPGLDLKVDSVRESVVSAAELAERADPGMFLAMIEGPEDGLGLVTLDAAATAACIDVQAFGHVLPMPAAGSAALRRPTRTDAALIAPMIDALLAGVAARQCPDERGIWGEGFVYGSFIDDPRPLALLLEDQRYRLAEVDLSFGGEDNSGRCIIALPLTDPVAKHVPQKEDKNDIWADSLRGAVESSAVTLDAVLYRLSMPLREALALGPGTVLRIPVASLEALTLETIDREVLARGRLGQARGARALRLTTDPGRDVSASDALPALPYLSRIPPGASTGTSIRGKERVTGNRPAVSTPDILQDMEPASPLTANMISADAATTTPE